MATVVAALSMSLDGFVAGPSGDVGPLFDWYQNGDVETRWGGDHPWGVPVFVVTRHSPHLPRQAGAMILVAATEADGA